MIQEITEAIASAIECTELNVEGEGGRYEITIVSDAFAGLNRVRKQQAVYAPIKHLLADGSVHAVTIKAYTPDEARD